MAADEPTLGMEGQIRPIHHPLEKIHKKTNETATRKRERKIRLDLISVDVNQRELRQALL